MICFGSIPAPRSRASTAEIQYKVWLGGGKEDFDFYELDMHSFSWTQTETGIPRPLKGNFNETLVPIQGNQLVLHSVFPQLGLPTTQHGYLM